MRARRIATLLALFTLIAGSSLPAAGQTAYEPPRTADGKPDLQGVWDFRTLTPLERPVMLGDKAPQRRRRCTRRGPRR